MLCFQPPLLAARYPKAPCGNGRTDSFPMWELQKMWNLPQVNTGIFFFKLIMTRLIQKIQTRKNTGSGSFPWSNRGEISREIGFRFCIITHSIEFNYFVVKCLKDKCLLSIYLHFLSGVITFFWIVWMRKWVLGNVRSLVWNESSICKVFSSSII